MTMHTDLLQIRERREQLLLWLTLVQCLAWCGGCAGWQAALTSSPVGPQREQRAAQAIREFEDRRDAAQLEAALERKRQGDVARCEAMLTSLVARRPDRCEARLRLAEVLWERGDLAAETHLRAVIEQDHQQAEAHHALGLVLEATGRLEEARVQLSAACQLDPRSEVYRQTRDALAE